ncbi:protein FAM167A-like [Mytilus trossulus]|uniref:protein FAM167A-like n=1 Tax=Mytilus trossulus TaxID=6551 RepID=UPI0030077C80
MKDLMKRRSTLPKIEEDLTFSNLENENGDDDIDANSADDKLSHAGNSNEGIAEVRLESVQTKCSDHIKNDSTDIAGIKFNSNNSNCGNIAVHFNKFSPENGNYTHTCIRSNNDRTLAFENNKNHSAINGFDNVSCTIVNNRLCTSDEETNDFDVRTSDLEVLKAKTAQLKLKTRRPSYVAWKQQFTCGRISLTKSSIYAHDNDPLTEDAANRIDSSLEWIRKELVEMRLEDQSLAKKFLKLRSDIHKLKLKWSCKEHEAMIEDTQDDIEDVQALQMICDRPLEPLRSEHLRKFGVTKMNIASRRFSTC